MKVAKLMLVLVLAIGLLAGCNSNFSPLTGGTIDALLIEEPAVEVVEPTTVRIIDKILFAFDSYKLDAHAAGVVQVVASLMERYPDTILALDGYTDKYGSAEYNYTLSLNRATAVKNALIAKGVETERIAKITGFGKTKLIPNLSNRENRRVIILSIGQ